MNRKTSQYRKTFIKQDRQDLANMVRSIQNSERDKLQVVFNNFERKNGHSHISFPLKTAEYQLLKKEYTIDREEEYDPILIQSIDDRRRALNTLVTNINEVLEELKGMKYELQEQ
jgi:hypothetical protein